MSKIKKERPRIGKNIDKAMSNDLDLKMPEVEDI